MIISLSLLHACAVLFRLGLVVYGEWQDRNMELKFTDVDYHVFNDAAKYVSEGESPYLRPTYRYTPILAWILVPCHLVHILWGKLVFVAADLLTGFLIQRILQLQCHSSNLVKIGIALWLFNPITMTVSSRGNAESVISVLVVGTIYALFRKCTMLSGFLFGLSVHLKIFPIVTAPAIYLYLGSNSSGHSENELSFADFPEIFSKNYQKVIRKVLSKERLQFFISFAFAVISTTLVFYHLYGDDFLENTYFYHIKRKDIRHNFSIYFYMLYTSSDWWLGLASFFTQIIVVLFLCFNFYEDLPFSSFLITFSFVAFNKICTSQYFLWYLTLVPLLVPGLAHVRKVEILCALGSWVGAQSAWLGSAYALEFGGESAFSFVWMCSLLFFFVNVAIVVWFVKRYTAGATKFSGIPGQKKIS